MSVRPSERGRRIGILGGSFNPPHRGHLGIARAARQAHALDEIIFVPTGSPPHKSEGLAAAADRLAMARLAAAELPGASVSDVEVERAGTTYTKETLEELARQYPRDELFFIIGDDSLADLPGWRAPAEILRLARVVAVHRPGFRARLRPDDIPGAPAELVERLERDRVTTPRFPLASSDVRARVRAGRPIDEWVPASVARYIEAHGLYRDGPGAPPAGSSGGGNAC